MTMEKALGIYKKLRAIMTDVDYIQKDKTNDFHRYKYASEQAIKEALHKALVEHKVIFTLQAQNPRIVSWQAVNQKGQSVELNATNVDCTYTFTDIDDGSQVSGAFVGSGSGRDDKGVYAAITGAIKYILTSTFLIPTGDDPENDDSQARKAQTATPSDVPFQSTNPARKTKPEPAKPTDYVTLINSAKSEQELEAIGTKIKEDLTISPNKKSALRSIYEGRIKALQHASESVPTPPTA